MHTTLNPQLGLAAAALTATLGGSAFAAIGDINSLVIQERRFNDFPGSTLTVTDNDFAGVRIQESGFVPDGGADFANRHVAWLSDDNVNRFAFQNGEGFEFFVDVNLNAGTTSPAKEAGILMDSLVGGEGQFILKAGGNNEIATFGSYFPFTSSTSNNEDGVEYNGQTYSVGTTVNIGLRYTPGDGAGGSVPATMEFFVDGVSGGVRDITNLENGVINGSQFGVYVQYPPDIFAGDFGDTLFSNFVFNALGADLNGDYNASGQVEQGDLDLVLLNWGQDGTTPPAGWTNDLPTGLIDQAELDGVLLNWGNTSEPAGSSVPEPATAALLAMGALGMLRRRNG